MQRVSILFGLVAVACITLGCGRTEPVPNAREQRPLEVANGNSTIIAAPMSPPPLPVTGATDSTSLNTGTQPAEALPGDWFSDVTRQTGISFSYQNGREAGRFLMIESFGGGTAVIDFDTDGDTDLFFTGGGTISVESPVRIDGLSSVLYRNEGNLQFTDVSGLTGVSVPGDYSQGCAFGDFNTDGFPDIVVCAYGRSRLYCNLGDGTFTEAVDHNQLPASGWGTAAAFADLDQDGFPDLFVACYTDWTPATDIKCFGRNQERDLCGPTSYAGTTCQLFRNKGDGGFEDWSVRSALKGNVHGLGVVATDLNDDGLVDLFVSSDALPNQLYLGSTTLPLVECGESAGVAFGEWGHADASMGIDVADFDGNGLPDLFVTNFENEDNALYRNIGGGLWMHSTVATGLSGISRMKVGFGTSMVDFDGDGWADVFVANGNPIYTTAISPFAQQPQLFRNIGGQRFEDVSQSGGPWFSEAHSGRGSTVGDLDDDGALDLITVPMNEPIQILRNCRTPDNYVTVKLHARQGDPDAVGACVVTTFAGRTLTQWVVHGSGFFSQRDERLIFPVDRDIRVTEVSVSWPGRSQEVFRGLATQQMHFLVEGRGEPADGKL